MKRAVRDRETTSPAMCSCSTDDGGSRDTLVHLRVNTAKIRFPDSNAYLARFGASMPLTADYRNERSDGIVCWIGALSNCCRPSLWRNRTQWLAFHSRCVQFSSFQFTEMPDRCRVHGTRDSEEAAPMSTQAGAPRLCICNLPNLGHVRDRVRVVRSNETLGAHARELTALRGPRVWAEPQAVRRVRRAKDEAAASAVVAPAARERVE